MISNMKIHQDNKWLTLQRLGLTGVIAVLLWGGFGSTLTSCKEDIDESNLYTFTGETIEGFLQSHSDQFSNFNYVLSRIGYDKILSAYGTYTCFAPRNEAIMEYIDSLYDDTSNKDLPHNGMTQRGLEGLTDSLCEDIALFHLLGTKVMSVYMNGMTVKTFLGRDINMSLDSVTTSITINRQARIDSVDIELENGVMHTLDHVITRSNNLVAGEMEMHPETFSLFSQALKATGLADSLSAQRRESYDPEKEYPVDDDHGFYVPERCELGYTIFAETDQTFEQMGITTLDDLAAYAAEQYAHCADAGSGWYDYAKSHGIKVSTGNDYMNPWNTLSMFVRYHVLPCKIPFGKLVNDFNQVGKVTLVEYYETMLPYTLVKVTRNTGKRLLNYWTANNSLTDRVADLGTIGMHTVMFPGVELEGQLSQVAAANGYIHPLKGVLVYDKNVPQGALNERLRFDVAALFGEMMSNGFRRISDSEVNAMNGGKTGTDGNLGGSYIRIPPSYFDNLAIYNGDDTRLYYLPGQSNGWSNYQGDEYNCKGNFDFAIKLPPVPEGTYELRLGYTANTNRGMLQFYLGTSSELVSMQALDIPLDMRYEPSSSSPENPDVRTGWSLYTSCDDQGVESDANMHNLGYMRGPLYYTVGVGGTVARANRQDLRRILTKQFFSQGDYWVRFKTVIDNPSAQFHLDYIELCPDNVCNNSVYAEDMY